MAKVSLDALRRGDMTVALPERSYALCLRGDLLAAVDRLLNKASAEQVSEALGDPDNLPPKRIGEAPDDPDPALAALLAEIEDNTGDLLLRMIPDGDWQRWVNEHPAREKNSRDEQVAYGICNADDLIEDLGRWVVSFEGDLLKADEWRNLLAPKVAGGDLKNLAAVVVSNQEQTDDPKWRLRGLLGGRQSSDTAASPEQ